MTTSSRLWRALERRIPPGTTGSVSFLVHVRTESETLQVQGLLRGLHCRVESVTQGSWPFGRRWRVAAQSAPMALAADSLRQWSDRLLAALAASDVRYSDWMLVPPAGEDWGKWASEDALS